MADLNGDGKMDIVVPNSIDVGTVSILLGNGDGTLKAHVDYPSGGRGPLWVGVGDLNGDGSLDLVVSNFNRYGSSSTVSVLLGKGDGTFSVGGSYTTGPDPHEGVLADFNGDGKLDLALTIQDSRNIWVFLGNGDGTFQPYVSFATPFGPTNLIAGDFNDDGKLDLATANSGFGTPGDTVSLLLGNGDGTFRAPVNYGTGVIPTEATLADFNGDGRLDLATANASDNTVSVLLQATTLGLSTTTLKFGDPVGRNHQPRADGDAH